MTLDGEPRDGSPSEGTDMTTTTERAADTAAWDGPHGHVTPRPDGLTARCPGAPDCPDCAAELDEAMAVLRQATDAARTEAAAAAGDGRIGDVADTDTLRARIPAAALAAAEALGSLAPEERRGDVDAERREILRVRRARLWAETLRSWPDDDLTRAGLDCLDPGQQPGAILHWIGDPDAKVLILTGKTGRGKTYAQFAIGNHYAGQGAYVTAISHKRFLDSLEPDGSDEPGWLIRRRAANAEVLLLDGFGDEMDPTSSASEFRRRETADLLSARLGRGKRTVISTNLRSQQLGVMFGDRVISRLRQGSTALIVQGEDRRAVDATW